MAPAEWVWAAKSWKRARPITALTNLNPAHSTSRRRELFQQHRQRQLNVSSKRRQGGKVETHSDLVMGREFGELEEVVIAVVGGERDQKQQGAGKQG